MLTSSFINSTSKPIVTTQYFLAVALIYTSLIQITNTSASSHFQQPQSVPTWINSLIMGVALSTARWAAPLSFAIDFAAQQYGMLASPNMKDVHDANLSFWSPQPYFIAAFFFPQQLCQLAWLYRLYKLDAKNPAEEQELKTMVDYVPYYAVGNLCIASEFLNESHGIYNSKFSQHG